MIERIYHPWWAWEEVTFNMWGKTENREDMLKRAIEFTGDHKLYGEYMLKVVKEWPKSCEHNLTNKTQNRRAWIGHAACALAFRCPEDVVREAWGYLNNQQQVLANHQADLAIKSFEDIYIGKQNISDTAREKCLKGY